jgi:hypothetical protein
VVLGLDLVEGGLEVLVLDAHDDIAEHVDQAAVGVVGEAAVAGLLGEALDGLVVEPEVEDGVHHAGHAEAAPERTETSSGFSTSPKTLPVSFSSSRCGGGPRS